MYVPSNEPQKGMKLTSIGPDGIAWLLGVCYAYIRILSEILISIQLLQGGLGVTGYVCLFHNTS